VYVTFFKEIGNENTMTVRKPVEINGDDNIGVY
jgi:hypothetical protein